MTADPKNMVDLNVELVDELKRLRQIIAQAVIAMEELRRGDALKMLKGAFPSEPKPGYPSSGFGGAA